MHAIRASTCTQAQLRLVIVAAWCAALCPDRAPDLLHRAFSWAPVLALEPSRHRYVLR